MRRPAAIRLDRDGVLIAGPDAESFLQGQLSQDVVGLDAGASAWSLLLEPTGRTVAMLRVTRMGSERFLLDLEAGHGDSVIERLGRFLIRIRVELEPVALSMLAVRGPGAREESSDGLVRHDPGWPGVDGLDVVGETLARPPTLDELSGADFDRLRIEAGIPTMGREIVADVIPAELEVIDRTVDFEKGCYTGQELVARIDSRGGNVPRRLRIVDVPGAVPPVGASVLLGGTESGVLSSVAGTEDGAIALGLLHRRVVAPTEVRIRWDGSEESATARPVPAGT